MKPFPAALAFVSVCLAQAPPTLNRDVLTRLLTVEGEHTGSSLTPSRSPSRAGGSNSAGFFALRTSAGSRMRDSTDHGSNHFRGNCTVLTPLMRYGPLKNR